MKSIINDKPKLMKLGPKLSPIISQDKYNKLHTVQAKEIWPKTKPNPIQGQY